MVRRSLVRAVALVCVVFAATFAAAQTGSGIAGVVKDETGAVLPGVTVEASSPALLERVRTVVTDAQGIYNFTNLSPGVYTVTFTLAGFNTVKREGIQLTSTFTATVNGGMTVGNVQETITVSGAAPTVDIQNTVQQKAFTREVIEDIPVSNKSWASLAILVPGVTLTGAQNVGGTASSNATATIHGSTGAEAIMLLDGMRYQQGAGFGGVRNGYNENDASVEEITFETAALGAATETGSFVRNIVPKAGGNTFAGFFGGAYTNHSLESNNLDDALRARKVTSVNYVDKVWDVNPGFGGPIEKDKLWFYTALRYFGDNLAIANTYFDKTPTGLAYTPDTSRPALAINQMGSVNLRLTTLVSPRNKLSLYYEIQPNYEPYNYGQGTLGGTAITPPESIATYRVVPDSFVQAHWTSPVTSRLLLEAGSTFTNTDFDTTPQPGNDPSLPAFKELSTGTVWRNLPGIYGHNASHQFNLSGSVSYVTGSHTFKAGALFLDSSVHQTRAVAGNGTVLQLLNGVPSSVVVYATPYSLDETLTAQVGAYAQDQWKIKRVNLYLGGRFDYYNAYVPAQGVGPGPNVPTRNLSFPEVPNVPNWKDFSPRLGVAWDVFGDGKTAVKGSFSRYVFGPDIVTFTALANPIAAIATSTTRSWKDTDGDYIPQGSELGPLSAATFGTPVITTSYDPSVLSGWGKRGYNWEGSASVQHELLPKVAVSAAYFRRWWGNLLVADNEAVSAGSYSPYCITAPVNSQLPGGGGNQVCGLYDVTQSKFGQLNNVVTYGSNLGNESMVYDGVDLNTNVRLGRGVLIAGGVNWGRTRDNFCYEMSNPALGLVTVSPGMAGGVFASGAPRTQANCDINPPFLPQGKFYGAVPLPWGLAASATFQTSPGPNITASYTATNAQIAPSLGRNLAAGANGTATVQLIPVAVIYGERLNQTDFRLSKTFKLSGGPRVQGQVDLYNLFNGNPVIAQNNTYGALWQQPTVVQVGRLLKFGVQLNF
jgi:hypothetical protein